MTNRPDQPDDIAREVERLRAENTTLRDENRVLRETLDTIEGSIVIYNSERRFLFANEAYHVIFPHLPNNSELFGRKYEEVLALSVAAGSVEDPQAQTDTEAFIERRIGDMERRRSMPREAYNSRPGRESYNRKLGRWFLLRSRRTPSGDDVTLRVDITQQKQFQQEAQQAREAAERANAMKSQFLTSVSHELRTPLNAVINFARLLADEIHGPLGAPQYHDYVQEITDGGTHLVTLIDELLDLAKAEAGHLTISERNTDPAALVATVCRSMRHEASKAGIELVCDIAGDLGRMQGDPGRLRQVLTNLVGNAVKFTGTGGMIHVSARRDGNGDFRIRICDTGIGILDVANSRVFEPFVRAADPRVAIQPGVGLGLPLAKYLVELHGGSLTLESEPEQGTTAIIILPASRALT